MRLQNRRLAVLSLVFLLATPAFAARDSEGFRERVLRVLQRVFHLSPVTAGDGLIPPIPGPKP